MFAILSLSMIPLACIAYAFMHPEIAISLVFKVLKMFPAYLNYVLARWNEQIWTEFGMEMIFVKIQKLD